MSFRPHHRVAILALAATTLAACSGKDAPNADARVIDLAPTKAAEPQLADAPVRKAEPARAPERVSPPKPKAAAPRVDPPLAAAEEQIDLPVPAPAPIVTVPADLPMPRTGAVPAGTGFSVKPAVRVCTNTYKAGDRFTAIVTNSIVGSNGAEIPAGATAFMRIVDAGGTGGAKDSLHLVFDILSIRVGEESYEVNAHVTESAPLDRVNSQTTTDKAKKVGVGAAIGAIAGRVLGGNAKSTVLGGVVGAAAGAAVAVGDNSYEGCLKDGAVITLALDRPLVIKLANAP